MNFPINARSKFFFTYKNVSGIFPHTLSSVYLSANIPIPDTGKWKNQLDSYDLPSEFKNLYDIQLNFLPDEQDDPIPCNARAIKSTGYVLPKAKTERRICQNSVIL